MFTKLYKFSKLVMYLNSCSMDLGRDSVGIRALCRQLGLLMFLHMMWKNRLDSLDNQWVFYGFDNC